MKKQVLFISKNFIRMLVLLIFVSIGGFALVSMAPLDPLQTNVGQAALGSMSPEHDRASPPLLGRRNPAVKTLSCVGNFIRA